MLPSPEAAASALLVATAADVIAALVLLYVSCAILYNAAEKKVGHFRALAAVLAFFGALSQVILGTADLLFGISVHRAIGARLSGAVCLIVAVLLLRAAFRREDTTLVNSVRVRFIARRQQREAEARRFLESSHG